MTPNIVETPIRDREASPPDRTTNDPCRESSSCNSYAEKSPEIVDTTAVEETDSDQDISSSNKNSDNIGNPTPFDATNSDVGDANDLYLDSSSGIDSEFSYCEDDDDEEEEDDQHNDESQCLIAIGILQEDDEEENQEDQEAAEIDEAVATRLAREEHDLKMRIKKERETAMARAKARQVREREEKMRTLRGRRLSQQQQQQRRRPHRLGSLSPSIHTAPPQQPLRRQSSSNDNTIQTKKPKAVESANQDDQNNNNDDNDDDDDDHNKTITRRMKSQASNGSSSNELLSSHRSVSSGIDLDEKTRQRIISRSIRGQCRRPSSLTNNAAAAAAILPRRRPSDDKRNMRITPRMGTTTTTAASAAAAAHHPPAVAAAASARPSRPCDEKANSKRPPASSMTQREGFAATATAAATTTTPSMPSTTPVARRESSSELSSSHSRSICTTPENNHDLDLEAQIDYVDYVVDDYDEEEEEPEILPGAFAVDGMGGDIQQEVGYDSGFEEDDTSIVVETIEADATHDPEEDGGDDNEDSSSTGSAVNVVAAGAPLQAELVEVEAALEAQVLIFEEDETQTKEKIRKLSFKMSFLAFLLLLVAGLVMGVVIPKVVEDNNSNINNDDDDRNGGPLVQGWTQVGGALTLQDPYKDNIRFGNAIALSADGNRVAIGLPGSNDPNDEAHKSAGSVVVLDLVNNNNRNATSSRWTYTWEVFGGRPGAELGTLVALSDDGMRIAIGEKGYISVYEESSSGATWDLVANIRNGSNETGRILSGEAIGFSGDGTILAIGDKYYSDDDDARQKTGVVKVYQEINGSWIRMGTDLFGSQDSDYFGWSVALSKDGKRVTASSVGNSQNPGHVKVFDFDGTDWKRVGSTILGESTREGFGVVVELSGDGSVVAVGATEYSRDGQQAKVGIVRSYRLDPDRGDWSLHGQPLEGDNAFDAFGSSIALSYNGTVIAIGGPKNTDFCGGCGHVQVFKFLEEEWKRIGSELGKRGIDGGEFGYDVALSESGTRLAGAAPYTTFNGFVSKVGQVLVFDSETPTTATTNTTSENNASGQVVLL